MRAVSLWQPWASGIALGLKKIETRGWTTRYRGPIAIHAAKRWGPDERDYARHFAITYDVPGLLTPPLGAIVAVARIVDIRSTDELIHTVTEREMAFGNYGPGRFGWLLEDVRQLTTPIPWAGKQGMFTVPDELFSN